MLSSQYAGEEAFELFVQLRPCFPIRPLDSYSDFAGFDGSTIILRSRSDSASAA